MGALALMLGLVVVVSSEQSRAGQAGVVCAPPGGGPGDPVAGFAGTQLANAAAIVAAGVELQVPLRAQVIAVATAMQESALHMYANAGIPASLALPHERVGRDHDSVGLFQQRGLGWGPLEQRMDPKGSARLFYERLLRVPGWESMPLAQAAQAVQVSAFPSAYARWEQPASEVVGSIAGLVCSERGGGGGELPSNPLAQQVIDRALSQLGVRYVWGGGNAAGPTNGSAGQPPAGFDCSGLMVYAFAGIGVTVPHQTQQIWARFQPAITDPALVRPGDMILLSDTGTPAGDIHHVALYLGDGRAVHAPQAGSPVQIVDKIWASPYWSREFVGAVRALPATNPRA